MRANFLGAWFRGLAWRALAEPTERLRRAEYRVEELQNHVDVLRDDAERARQAGVTTRADLDALRAEFALALEAKQAALEAQAERVDEIDRHRWELQHRINVMRDETERAREESAATLAARAQRVEEIDRHRWELQHRVNVLREDFERAREAGAATRVDHDALRGEFELAARENLTAIAAHAGRFEEIDRRHWDMQHRVNLSREDAAAALRTEVDGLRRELAILSREAEAKSNSRSELLDAIDRHRWELQHRINAQRDDFEALRRELESPKDSPGGEVERVGDPEEPSLSADEGERLAALDRHHWALQHRVNLMEEALQNANTAAQGTAIAAAREELAIFRRDFELVFREVYGTVGSSFQRMRIAGAGDSVGERFGQVEVLRREGLEEEGSVPS